MSDNLLSEYRSALDPQRWRLITSLLPDEVAPGRNERMQRWLCAHETRHAHIEVMISLSGEGWYGLHSQLYRIRPGRVMLFDANEPHQDGYPPFASPQEHLWMSVVPTHFTARLVRIGQGKNVRPTAWTCVCSRDDAGILLDRRAFGHAGVEHVPKETRRTRLLSTVCGMVAAVQEHRRNRPTIDRRAEFQTRMLQTLRRHIEETAGKGVTLSHLARIAGYSKFHLHRLYREQYGETIQAYIDACRRRRVSTLISQGVPKKQIADILGFSCAASFSRWLRQQD